MKDKTAVIIPAYNEEKNIQKIIKEINKINPQLDVIVGNDGSKDRTTKEVLKTKAKLINEEKNHGKGWIARKACDWAVKKGFEKIILIDADGQHKASDIPKFLEKLKTKDIIFSYRVGNKQPMVFNIGNWGLNLITRILFGIKIKDSQSGFRAFTKKTYKQIRWKSNDYTMESEMIARSKGLKYDEIAIEKIYDKEHKGEDKGTNIRTGLRIGWKMLMWKLRGLE